MGRIGDQPNMGFHPVLLPGGLIKWRLYAGTTVDGHYSSEDLTEAEMQRIVDTCLECPRDWNELRAVVFPMPGCEWVDSIPQLWRDRLSDAITLCYNARLGREVTPLLGRPAQDRFRSLPGSSLHSCTCEP